MQRNRYCTENMNRIIVNNQLFFNCSTVGLGEVDVLVVVVGVVLFVLVNDDVVVAGVVAAVLVFADFSLLLLLLLLWWRSLRLSQNHEKRHT